jgi:sn-glycerol 3-phosphate transport system substrate-binding protein
MKRRTLIAASGAVPLAAASRAHGQSAKTQVIWWHAMTGVLADELNRLASAFNASQSEAEVQRVFKGG